MQARHNLFAPATGEAEPGLPAALMCISVYRVWHACLGGMDPDTAQLLPEWEETSDDYRYGWERGIGSTTPTFTDGEGWQVAANRLYCNVQASIADGVGYKGWDQLDALGRLVWEACVRHLVNLVYWAEGDDPAQDFEQRMGMWFNEKVEQRGLAQERPRTRAEMADEDGDSGYRRAA